MTTLKHFFRYNSFFRSRLYRLMTRCDGIDWYRRLYAKRIRSKTSRIPPFPPEFSIETTNLCNAKCTICAHPAMQRTKGKMDTALVHSLIDQAAEGKVSKLFISGFGEPLLDNRLADFVAYANGKGITNISIVTNGYLLTADLAQQLIEAGLSEVSISVDGFSAHTYESVRAGLKFDRLRENIQALSRLKNRRRAKVILSCVDLVQNRHERKLAYDIFGRFVDMIVFRQAQGWTARFAQNIAWYSPHFEPNSIPCRYLWDSASVYIDGTVPTCCLDYEAVGVMGDASRQSIEEIWHGPSFSHYRALHLQNRKSELIPCKDCGYYSVWW